MEHRVYYAVTFNEEETKALIKLRSEFIKACSEGKPIPKNSMHMTLAFLGNVGDEDLSLLRLIRESISFEPFTFQLSKLGYFPDQKDSRLYYLTSSQDEALYALQKALTDALKKHQVAFHDRQFLPHLTLSRKTILKEEPQLSLPLTLTVSSFHLLESIPYENTRIGINIDKTKDLD